ncbi:hypothetical protein MHYP_G00202120 [Metynnis hypsauchen]
MDPLNGFCHCALYLTDFTYDGAPYPNNMTGRIKERDISFTMINPELQDHGLVSEVDGFQLKRPSSPVPSGVSLKSDRSMKMPINYSEEALSLDESSQLKRSSSPEPSYESLKSDRSMKMPINYSEDPMPPEERFDLDTLEAQSKTLKLIFRERYQHLFEGTAQLGNPVTLNEIYTELYMLKSSHPFLWPDSYQEENINNHITQLHFMSHCGEESLLNWFWQVYVCLCCSVHEGAPYLS